MTHMALALSLAGKAVGSVNPNPPVGAVLARDGEVVVWKQAASGFVGTHLAPLLIHRKIDTCIIAGTATSGCVRAAAVDAIAANFRTVVVEEAVCDKSLWAHKATLFDLWRYIATVASVRDVLDWMAEWGERNGTATP